MSMAYPQEICDRAKRLTDQYGTVVAAEILGIHRVAIYRMKQRGWKAGSPGRKRPMPGDFPIQVKHLKFKEIRAHYVAGQQAVSRWKRELRG